MLHKGRNAGLRQMKPPRLVELLRRAEHTCTEGRSYEEREAAYASASALRQLIKEYGDDAD